jgi:ribosomal protein S18 acetylase RimI-like enzyme
MVLIHLAVSPSARHKHAAQHLLHTFEMTAKDNGMVALLLEVNEWNKAARQLYEKCGWRVFSTPRNNKKSMQYVRLLAGHL